MWFDLIVPAEIKAAEAGIRIRCCVLGFLRLSESALILAFITLQEFQA